MAESTRRGRRPVGSRTREVIVEAARRLFAEQGYDATSMRAIAREAGVDPKLIGHYFAGKPELFAQVFSVPLDPAALIDRILTVPLPARGEALARTFLGIWDSAAGRQRFAALMGAASTHEDAARTVREFFGREVIGRLVAAERVDDPRRAELLASLAASQLVGVGMLRYVIGHPPLVAADVDDIVELLAPTLQKYLVGE